MRTLSRTANDSRSDRRIVIVRLSLALATMILIAYLAGYSRGHVIHHVGRMISDDLYQHSPELWSMFVLLALYAILLCFRDHWVSLALRAAVLLTTVPFFRQSFSILRAHSEISPLQGLEHLDILLRETVWIHYVVLSAVVLLFIGELAVAIAKAERLIRPAAP